MTTYTVHILDTGRTIDVVLVPDRFSWMAAIFGFVWALLTGAWSLALVLFGVQVGAGVLISLLNLSEAVQSVAHLGVSVAIGFCAFELRRWLLSLKGYRETDVVTGTDREDAERRYFDTHPVVTARLLGAVS